MPGGICTELITADAASTAQYQITQIKINYLRNTVNTFFSINSATNNHLIVGYHFTVIYADQPTVSYLNSYDK
jgi:hypothetical protein